MKGNLSSVTVLHLSDCSGTHLPEKPYVRVFKALWQRYQIVG